jgi:hypothetical protein
MTHQRPHARRPTRRSPALRGAPLHRPQRAAGRADLRGFPKGGHCGLARGAAMRRAKPARRPPLAGDPRGPAGPLAGGLGVGDPRHPLDHRGQPAQRAPESEGAASTAAKPNRRKSPRANRRRSSGPAQKESTSAQRQRHTRNGRGKATPKKEKTREAPRPAAAGRPPRGGAGPPRTLAAADAARDPGEGPTRRGAPSPRPRPALSARAAPPRALTRAGGPPGAHDR